MHLFIKEKTKIHLANMIYYHHIPTGRSPRHLGNMQGCFLTPGREPLALLGTVLDVLIVCV